MRGNQGLDGRPGKDGMNPPLPKDTAAIDGVLIDGEHLSCSSLFLCESYKRPHEKYIIYKSFDKFRNKYQTGKVWLYR